jgi:hypothetical protein
MEDTDFDLLCVGLSPDEAKRMRKILAEWNDGDETGFPVQLAMLTRAQWRAAALIPRTIKDSGKIIELHLAECRHQTAAIVKNLSTVAGNNAVELKNIVKAHAETVQQASVAMRNQLWESEEVSRRIKTRLEDSRGEWKKARDDFAAERLKLEKERKELSGRVQRRDTLYAGIILLGAVGFGASLEYFFLH